MKLTSPSSYDVARVVAIVQRADGVAVSRAELALRTGLCDRVAREAVAEAVNQGYPICPDRKLGGYRYDPAAIQREIRSLDSTIARLSERRKALAKYGLPVQEEMFG